MGVIGVVSAKGAPGATTVMVALTRAWASVTPGRRAIGMDLDPCGGDVAAGVLAGSVPSSVGVLTLATGRSGDARGALEGAVVTLGSDPCGAALLPGVPDAARAGAIALAWDSVAAALPQLEGEGVDVIVDGGRLDGTAPDPPWCDAADRLLLVVRPSLPWVNAAYRLARGWTASAPIGLVVVEAPSPYTPREVARAVGVPLLATIPHDPRAAAVHSDGHAPSRRYAQSPFARAVDRLAAQLATAPTAVAGADKLPGTPSGDLGDEATLTVAQPRADASGGPG